MVKKVKFMQVWSINLLRFIKASNIRHVNKFTDKSLEDGGSGKDCWVFEITDELEDVLKKYTIQKNKALNRKTTE